VEGASTVVVSVVAAFVVALWLPDTSEAESAAGGVESALADPTSQVGFRTLPAQVPGSLHLEDPHSNNLPLKDVLIDP
jgi:hypothetical protein